MGMRWWCNLLLILAILPSLHLGPASGTLVCLENDGTTRIEAQDGFGRCHDKLTDPFESTVNNERSYAMNPCAPCVDLPLHVLIDQPLRQEAAHAIAPTPVVAIAPAIATIETPSIPAPGAWQSLSPFPFSYQPRITVLLI